MEKKENILGTEKIGKLIRKFSIPCIISMLVNSLYNIVDQIFIGQGVGMLGNGATNVVFPIVILSLAIALMFGDGASAYLSLKLGEKKKDDAAKGVGNGIVLSAVSAILLAVVASIFLNQLLNLFGCTDNLREYASGYGRIITIGLPFMIVGISLNSIIRADGNPRYAMTSMCSGAILNVILDPIFIFVFKMGVEGAAIATVISQILTFILNLVYIKKFKSIHITKDNFKLKLNVSRKIFLLGVSSFITELSFVILSSVANNLLGKYGAYTKYGSEIPITVVGIVMKVSQILYSIVLGIAIGSQPILGYNYGAKKYDRVKQTLKIVLGLSVTIMIIAFILFQTIPDKLILLFGNGDENYMEFACFTFRIYLALCICAGVQIPSGIFFQAIGKSSKSAILSLSRQILFLIPAMFILSNIFGLMGLLYAGAVADCMSFILAVTLLTYEIKKLDKEKKNNSTTLSDDKKKSKNKSKNIIITISREYGSGGRYVGKLVAEKLGIRFYDKDFTRIVAQETGFAEDFIENNEQKRDAINLINNGYYSGLTNSDELFLQESNIIKEIADRESCVIIGRCADFILRNYKNVFRVFIYSDMESKIKRATDIYGIDKKKAEKEIKRIDRLRAIHYKHYTEKEWKNESNYDICINSDLLGVEKCADLIVNLVKQKNK